MPVLYWFAWIGQHGRPVLPPWTLSLAAHTTHPYNLVMTDTDTREGTEARTRETESEREGESRKGREGGERGQSEDIIKQGERGRRGL